MTNTSVYTLNINREAKVFSFDTTSELDSAAIASDILQFKEQFPESNKSNVIGWHSGYFAHKQSNIFDKLINLVENKVSFVINDSDFKISVAQCWAIIYNKGDGAVLHSHSDTVYSAVYYADVENNASPLKFENGITLLPTNGKLIIFPGWLKHEVPPMRFNSKRIVVAFNINCTLKTYEERI